MANSPQKMSEVPPDSGASTTHTGSEQYLCFKVLGERCAINILDVKEIIEMPQLTRVPMALAEIRGVINLRGNVAPVIDLAQRFRGKTTVIDRRSIILVVQVESEGERQVFGMLAEEVNEIVEIGEDHLQPAPEFGAGLRRDFIHSMARVGEQFIVLLDLNQVLSIAELSVHPGQNDRARLDQDRA